MAVTTAIVIGATAAVAGTSMSFIQAGEQKKHSVKLKKMLMRH